jgi:hypothetical protein
MVTLVRTDPSADQSQSVQAEFQAMLPQIRRRAHLAFRHLDRELCDELVAEAVATAYRLFVALARQGRLSLAYPTPLANYAIRRVCSGRKAACRMKRSDVLSDYGRRVNALTIERLDRREKEFGQWRQILVQDRRAGPADIAIARLDVAAWLRTLSKRNRSIARALAIGESTKNVAKQFGLSSGRISQLRDWFRRQWHEFQGEAGLAGASS